MKPLNILFADDSQSLGAFVSGYLEDAGHTVTYVTSGEDAVRAYRHGAFDLVLMDILMPGIGGLEAVRQIKAIRTKDWVPLIIVTALNSEEDLLSGFMAGADDYIQKPLNPVALDLRIRAMMRIASIQRTTASVVDSVIEGIVQIDRSGSICRFNRAAERIFGYAEAEVIGRNVNMLMPSPFRENHDQYLENYITTGTAKVIGIGRKVTGKRKNGDTFPMHLGITEAATPDGKYFVGLVRDLTDEEKMLRQIEYLATHDSLTGLPNRIQCWRHLGERFSLGSENCRVADCSVFYCDLDGFKKINDHFGHAAGDAVLRDACQQIKGTLFVRDFMSRIGGDEFIVVVDGHLDEKRAACLADKMIAAVSRLSMPDHEHHLGLSVGIAHARDFSDSVASLINAADAAMYRAKQAGKGRAMLAETACCQVA